MDHLPPPEGFDHQELHLAGIEERHKSQSPWKGAAQMKDFQRSKIKDFNGHGSGYVAKQWLITIDQCFFIQDFDSNVKARFSITNLEVFGATWWTIKEKNLGMDMNIAT